MNKVFITLTAAFVMAPALLGGCSLALLDSAAHGIFQSEDVNLSEKNFAAADYLAHQARTFMKDQTIIKVSPLGEAYEPNMTSRIGKLIPQQVGVRFSQLGYSVDLSEVVDEDSPAALGPFDKKGHALKFAGRTPSTVLLNGTYSRTGSELQVNLRMIDTVSGRVVGAFDYSFPMSEQVADLSEPRPRIFKIPQ